MARFGVFDAWFRPKAFESEHLYEALGALILKRYVPTGGDLVMRRLRRDHPERRWVTSSLDSLYLYERRTCLNESIHLIGFTVFAGWDGEVKNPSSARVTASRDGMRDSRHPVNLEPSGFNA